jgi:hypothetical protein
VRIVERVGRRPPQRHWPNCLRAIDLKGPREVRGDATCKHRPPHLGAWVRDNVSKLGPRIENKLRQLSNVFDRRSRELSQIVSNITTKSKLARGMNRVHDRGTVMDKIAFDTLTITCPYCGQEGVFGSNGLVVMDGNFRVEISNVTIIVCGDCECPVPKSRLEWHPPSPSHAPHA